MGRSDKPSRREIKAALADARDTPVGNLGISTDDALDAIQRGKQSEQEGKK